MGIWNDKQLSNKTEEKTETRQDGGVAKGKLWGTAHLEKWADNREGSKSGQKGQDKQQ